MNNQEVKSEKEERKTIIQNWRSII